VIVDPTLFPPHRLPYLRWAERYLEVTAERPPRFGCFGVHEWAMVYREPNVRHGTVPLRVAADTVASVVEEASPLPCTHYDAFRFFSPAAAPRNHQQLDRSTQLAHEQRGCLHANMDLYKFAYKLHPWIEGAVLAQAFFLALRARIVDMRASPYDLRGWGFEPIRIEDPEGRDQYVAEQRAIAAEAVPIRAALRTGYRSLRALLLTIPPERLRNGYREGYSGDRVEGREEGEEKTDGYDMGCCGGE
jgi:hypothetical protein